MKLSAYIIGSIEIIVGSILLSITSIIKEVLPVLGYAAYQAAAAGSYSPSNYAVSFPLVTMVSTVLIVLGVLQIGCFGVIKKKA